MHPLEKFATPPLIIILNYSGKYGPYVVGTIYEKRNASIFLIFFANSLSDSIEQLPNFYEKNPQAIAYFILDTMFLLCL